MASVFQVEDTFARLTDQYLGKQSAKNKRLSALEVCVNVAAGMQNDLVELEKDATTGSKPNKIKFNSFVHLLSFSCDRSFLEANCGFRHGFDKKELEREGPQT